MPRPMSQGNRSECFRIDGVKQIAQTTRFDYYCWDLYSRVTEWYEDHRERLAIRAAALHDLEHGIGETASMGAVIVDRVVRAHLRTMSRLNIAYDLLTYEGDILRLKFWAHAFEILKQSGAVFLQTQGKLAGCWVMRIENGVDSVGAELARPDSSPNTVGAELARPNSTRPDGDVAADAVRADGERGADDASREKVIAVALRVEPGSVRPGS